ncbi:galactose mutarotase-like enzyme [Oceanotoga teriensis]|jgi:galactose mutarotase-like enzyme|uniref:Galactose mutarotase-like enzyme n=1 Tax=Oceanotoga teriensis TaxID=515440 RepID=A0AA45C6H0_9BACT|nr:aldose 1-epimerase family protein [Oceanotoga teriensis]PWJ92085.1 galactose mutarotase-like enzyme [Oceanotoga teriensis]
MLKTISNENLKIVVDSSGAQLISIKNSSNIEFLWTADKKYWGRHAPILFPIVGKVKNNEYTVNGKVFELGQHGFARDLEFDLKESSTSKLTYSLKYDENTLKKYPYKFELIITYEIIEDSLFINYEVINLDDKRIYFSIGAHPGFKCPILENESFEDYYLEFENNETINRECLNTELGLFSRKSIPYLKNEKIIKLNHELFNEDALIFKNLKSSKISLRNNKNEYSLTVDFKGFPFLGIWSQKGESPFICIEPWYGHADFEDFDGDFSDKEDSLYLDINKKFNCTYSIKLR